MAQTQLERLYHNNTPAALEDKITATLLSKKTAEVVQEKDCDEGWYNRIYIFHPYQQQAEHLLYKINVYDPTPEFVIWIEDIPEGLTRQLNRLGKVMMKHIITDVVRRIYESVDPEYYYINGIHGKVKWRFGED
jgi:hypothetical protein